MANKYAKHSKRKESRGCRAKRFFDTEEAAIAAKALSKKPHLVNHYKCRFCAGWHWTSQLPRGNTDAGR